jgi:glutaredoxin 3
MIVKIYSTQSCPWCAKTKDWMKAHKVSFKDIDVGSDTKAAQEMMKKSGQTAVPVIDIDGTIIVGFDEAAIKKALKLK